LSEDEKNELAEDVKRSGGVVRILVHPYYSLGDIRPNDHLQMQDKIDSILQKILSKDKDHCPPIIFMEGYLAIDYLYQFIRRFNTDDVYIAPTFSDSSQPYPHNDSTQKPTGKVFNSDNWQEFIQLLQSFGVEKVIIGGQYLMIPQRPGHKPESIRYGQCLGRAINNLRTEFEVQLSNASNVSRANLRSAIQTDNKSQNENFEVDI